MSEKPEKRKNARGGVDDGRVMGYLLSFFGGAVTISLLAWLLGTIHFARPFVPWAADFLDWLDGFFQNFGTEMFGAFLTFYLIEVLLAKRRSAEAGERAEAERKEALILQLGSPDYGFAIEAARILKKKGWLKDGTLQGIDLCEAKLQKALLSRADLRRAVLLSADLHEAHLEYANLEGAELGEANLEGSHLIGANLQDADLVGARLQKSSLIGANLQDANLEYAYLHGANLQAAILPDGTELPNDNTWDQSFRTWLEEHEDLSITYDLWRFAG